MFLSICSMQCEFPRTGQSSDKKCCARCSGIFMKEIIKFAQENKIEYCCVFFAFRPPFVIVNNLDVFQLPLNSHHQLSLMRFTEHNGSPVLVCLVDVI